MTGVTGSSGYRWDEIVDPLGGHELQLCSGGNGDMLREPLMPSQGNPGKVPVNPGQQ